MKRTSIQLNTLIFMILFIIWGCHSKVDPQKKSLNKKYRPMWEKKILIPPAHLTPFTTRARSSEADFQKKKRVQNFKRIWEKRKPFITTWGVKGGSGVQFNMLWGTQYSIDCNNDGIPEKPGHVQNHQYICQFKKDGYYQIAIRGDDLWINIDHKSSIRLRSVDQWGDIKWYSMADMFKDCHKMILRATDRPDLSAVKDLSGMFYGAKRFNQDIGQWDVSHIINMQEMFHGAEKFNQDIGQWNVSNVTNMKKMFRGAEMFNQDISLWKVSNVERMDEMFRWAVNFNQDLSNWNVSNVTDMSYMFFGAREFNQSIGTWNVGRVTNMSYMFYQASSFNQDISMWNVHHVVDMSAMFYEAFSFNQDLSQWSVKSVRKMGYMFVRAKSFNQNLSGWSVKGVDFCLGFNNEGILKKEWLPHFSRCSQKHPLSRQSATNSDLR